MGEGNGNGNGNGRLKITFDQAWKIAVLLLGIGGFIARTEMNQAQTKDAVASLSQTMIASNQATAADIAKLVAQNERLLDEVESVKRRLPRTTRFRSDASGTSTAREVREDERFEPWQ